MSKQAFIEALSAECANYNHPRQAEMAANLLDTVSSDIYSESQRFVFELIQNADDSSQGTENEVYFDFYDNYIVVSHDGKPFTEADIRAITSAGASEKEADPTKTGYKGIGFKSVFGKSNWVGIFSDGYNFRFEKAHHQTRLPWQVIPIWTEGTELDSDAVKYLTQEKYQVSTVIYLSETVSLQAELEDLLSNAQILLFLRRVAKISVSVNGVNHYTISKTSASQEAAFQRVSLWKNTQEISSWLVKYFDSIPIDAHTRQELKKDEKTPLKLKEAEFTEIAFAARVESDRIRALKGDESLVFTYLPTKVADFAFPFLVNGSFLTNAAREALHEDRIWNQWLIGVVATKLFDWLQELALTSHRFEILQLLPPAFAGTGHELKRAFATSAAAAIATQAFIPSNTLSLKKVSEVVIDDTGLASLPFLSAEAVVAFVNLKTGKSFDPDSFANRDLQLMNKLRPLGATFFDADNLEQFFLSDTFTASHQVGDNHALIEYFFKKATKFDSTGEWNYKLKLIPFIYSDDEELKSPATICFPSLSSFQTEFGETVSVINPTVYANLENNADLKNWLESLGIKEPSDTAYLENEILGNIEKCITKDNFQKVTRYLFNQNKKGALSQAHLDKLQDLRLLCSNGKLIAAKDCYLSDLYEPALKLEQVNKLAEYVSAEYKQPQDFNSEWKTFFLKVGVSENISLIHASCRKTDTTGVIEGEYFDLVIKEGKAKNGYPSWITELNHVSLDKIRSSHYAHKYEFSKLFWEQVFKTVKLDKVQPYALIPWGIYGSKERVTNYFHWFLKNVAVFPTTQHTCLKASQVYLNLKEINELAGSHLPVFNYSHQLPDDWKTLLNFKSHLELSDYLKILESVAKPVENDGGEVSKAERKRIGLIYNKLAAFVSECSTADKATLHVWSTQHHL